MDYDCGVNSIESSNGVALSFYVLCFKVSCFLGLAAFGVFVER